MSGSSFFTILVLASLSIMPAAETYAQTGSSRFGPVVNAYLTGLEEELNELEFQLTHREISRADYERARQRLLIVRRFVEAFAAGNNEDLVPEFQVLTEDELPTLGLRSRPDPNSLIEGQTLDNQWRLISIERGKPRFFVFELVSQPGGRKAAGSSAARQSGRGANPSDVIETIVVPETPPLRTPPPRPEPPIVSSPASGPVAVAPPPPAWKSPQIIFIYLPQYTDKARNSGIEGDVVAEAAFLADGRVADVRIEKELEPGLDRRVVETVRRIGFLPAQRNGREVDSTVRIVFTFSKGKVSFYLKSGDEGEPYNK